MANCLTLKKSNCKSCFRCVRKCPVKAIRFSGNQAHIIGNECILCGNCVVQCPQNAKEIADGIEKTRVLLQSKDPVVVSLAPSFIANYDGVGIESMRRALCKLGFHDVEETAIGATIVKNEYERMIKEEERDVIITSCCHSINLLIQKRFPECLEYLADVMSPMQAHCSDIKSRIPGAKTVFIGLILAIAAGASSLFVTVFANTGVIADIVAFIEAHTGIALGITTIAPEWAYYLPIAIIGAYFLISLVYYFFLIERKYRRLVR